MDEDANDNVDAWVADMDAARLKARRERIATVIMAGLAAYDGEIAETKLGEFGLTRPVMAAMWAVGWADALIAELDKSERK